MFALSRSAILIQILIRSSAVRREDPGACSEGLPERVRWYFDKLSRTV